MKFLVFLFSFLISVPVTGTPDTYIYLCNSPGGKKYHYNRYCRGLNACKSGIIKVTIEEAKRNGKTLCGWESQ